MRGRGFFLVAAVAWAAMVVGLPSVQPKTLLAATPTTGASGLAAGGTSAGASSSVTAPAVPTAAAANGRASAPPPNAAAFGVARSGVECRPGVRQIPDSTYAPQCVAKFSGDNGGATANGVSATTIKLADRYLAASVISGGGPPPAKQLSVINTFLKYFNDTFELYGRHVEVEEYQSPHGDALAEATNKGRDAACEDAIALAQEHHDFGVVYSQALPFEDCAAQNHLVVFDAEGRATESFLAARDPYLWTFEQECDRVAYSMLEYAGKRLLNRPATWAGEADYRTRRRKFGVMIPDTPELQPCLAIVTRGLAQQYGVTDVQEFDYQADPSSLSDQTARAAIKFKAAGVTTIVMGTDPYTFQFMTQSAHNQNWFPEWINIGVSGDDTDDAGQTYDQTEVDGHMFGRTEYLPDAFYGSPNSEAARLYRKLTGKPFPSGVGDGGYRLLLEVFTMLQQAGPNLTPAAIGAANRAAPIKRGEYGVYSFQFNPDGSPGFSHGSMLDANELWWDGSRTGVNGKRGTFLYNSQRYLPGQWPSTPPDVYPGRP